ncbi:MAG: cob(I)yrinic acid a,c-diamide adenosyltransferase [Candidatus Omnitrophica bacterium]|nr:cob(I)yrinic acid a,c-diamide adenosyltransferase [Candidatus Omnitrophota bacterium]MDD5236939.1 cob(I)yrinic acid a,c-diamide adenosyltransferase [Candidatus Omnitrophota bacterium]MDD5610268.1 cob(I)yrinic acid a,c-diamide adenosyltransferase [Candidatus Omnitrophota bacterium]
MQRKCKVHLRGLVQIYTGEGKGKTTQAVGQAVRAAGNGFKVCLIHFFKDPEVFPSGEDRILKKIGIRVIHCATHHPRFCRGVDKKEARLACLDALKYIRSAFKRKFDMLIVDEINIALRDGLLREKEIISLLKDKPRSLNIVFTGRGASRNLMRHADLVSEIKKIKHHFDQGNCARKAIEY